MTNIEVSQQKSEPAPRPRGVFEDMRDEMNRVLQRFEGGWPHWAASAVRWPAANVVVPELDVHDNDKEIIVEAELPGVEEKDITVTFDNGYLTIKGDKKVEREEKKENYYLAERSFGSFQRSLRLPDTFDDSKIEARFDKGVLRISAPKRPEAKTSERKIEISNA